jgi:hypothetical protein
MHSTDIHNNTLPLTFRFAETVATIIPLIEPLSKDLEPVVKQHLVEQLRHLAKVPYDCCLTVRIHL